MPELPEVETICQGIAPHIIGRKVREVHYSGKALRKLFPENNINSYLIEHEIRDVKRRAKYILVEFDNNNLLVIHLGMTGNLGIFSKDTAPSKHCHVRFLLNDGMELRYTDIRRFGYIQFVGKNEVGTLEETLFSTTGPEPFSDSFTGRYLRDLAKNRSAPVKNFIMTNQVVAGVGNIYANESLFAAGISPIRKVDNISLKRWNRLVQSIRSVLEHAIECGGSTISDYVNADQESGYFQMNFKVYGKEGEACRQCGEPIKKITVGGRASYYCSRCQK